MSKVFSHRLSWKLFTLSLLIAGLVFLSIGHGVKAEECCIDEYNTCDSQCTDVYNPVTGQYETDYACHSACQQTYADCEAPGPPGCHGPAQPQTPCQGCLTNCDEMQQQCLASGTQTPQQCAFLSYRCRQRCNLYCIY